MARCVVGSILHGGPIDLLLVPASAPALVNKGRGISTTRGASFSLTRLIPNIYPSRKAHFYHQVQNITIQLHWRTTKEGRKEMFYLTTHSTHFVYCYMASDIW